MSLRLKGKEGNKPESFKRKRKNFNLESYRQKLKSCHWEELYSITDTERANNWLEDKLRVILQEECPISIVQPNNKLKSWVTEETVKIFRERDIAREDAKRMDTNENWRKF